MLARLVPIAERSFSGSTGSDGTAGAVTEFEVPGGVGDGVVLPDGAGVVGDGVVLPDGAGVVVVGALFCPGGAFPAGFVFPAGVAVIPLGEPFT